MKNKFKLFLTFNYILIFSLNILLPIEVKPDKITQMQIKAIQAQLKNKTLINSQDKLENSAIPEDIVKMDFKKFLKKKRDLV